MSIRPGRSSGRELERLFLGPDPSLLVTFVTGHHVTYSASGVPCHADGW
jgi:hypothetical protein